MLLKKKVTLNISGLKEENKQKAKKEVADLLIDATLESVSQGKSPVNGEGKWKKLNKDYADREKGGDRTPNMELTGDMLDALEAKISSPKRNYVTIQIGGSEAEKAESHNHLFGEGTNPRRRFIPDEEQSYKTDIQREIERIEAKYKAKDQREKARERERAQAEETRPTARESIDFTVPTSEFTGPTSLVDALLERLDGR